MTPPPFRFEWERLVRRSLLSPTTKLVGYTLSQYSDPNGTHCWPGNVKLAATTRVSQRTVRRALEQLRAAGLIVRVRRGSSKGTFRGSADEYELAVPGDWLEVLQALDADERPCIPGSPNGTTTGSGWPEVGSRPADTDDRESHADLRTLTTRPPDTDDTTSGHRWPTTTHRPSIDQPSTSHHRARASRGCPHGDPAGPRHCALCRGATAPWDRQP